MPLLWLFSVILGFSLLGRAERGFDLHLGRRTDNSTGDVTGPGVSAPWQWGQSKTASRKEALKTSLLDL